MPNQVSFKVDQWTADLIQKCVDRTWQSICLHKQDKVLALTMDLTAVHANDVKIDFKRLLEADDFNFAHDIVGIQKHLNRETGKLENCFLPRFALREEESA